MSLYEFYLLATQDDLNPDCVEDMVKKASWIYKDETFVRISMAMFSFLSGDLIKALRFMKGLEEKPDAWIYFSYLYTRKKEFDKAEQYALKAAATGNESGIDQLKLIKSYRENETYYHDN